MKIEEKDNKVILSREYNAPKELVFSMFQNPHIQKWWGPSSWPVTVSTMDFTVGGTWHYCMTGPDGTNAWGLATYELIDEPNKIIFVDAFSNADGGIDSSLPMGKSIITFEEKTPSTTLLTINGIYESKEQREKIVAMGMLEGMKETWQQLDALLNDIKN